MSFKKGEMVWTKSLGTWTRVEFIEPVLLPAGLCKTESGSMKQIPIFQLISEDTMKKMRLSTVSKKNARRIFGVEKNV